MENHSNSIPNSDQNQNSQKKSHFDNISKKLKDSKLVKHIKTIIPRIKKDTYHIIARDFKISKWQIAKLSINAMVISLIFTFFLVNILEGVPHFDFDYNIQILILVVSGLSMLFGGIITDYLIQFKFIYEVLAMITVIPMFGIVTSAVESVIILCGLTLAVVSSLLMILLFTEILRMTDLLNRARIVTFITFIMLVFSAPLITLIILFSYNNWVIFVVLGFSLISTYLIKKKPEEFEESLPNVEQISLMNYLRTIKESGGIPYFLFLLFTSLTLGFFASSAINVSFNTGEIIATSIVGVISVPLVAIILDNIGRKIAGYIALFLVGIFCIFFDYPSITPFAMNPFRMAIYVFSAMIILILTITVAGDLSSIYSRGRILGVFLFATILGALLGSLMRTYYFTNEDFEDPDFISRLADISTLLIFIVTFAYSRARDPFQSETPDWRKFIFRFYLISDNGISLFNHDFRQKGTIPNEDLVTGGLSGLQALLKEISLSEKNIEVVNHGDIQIIFHYGKYSNAVLFVKQDLNVLREKLASFHLRFENINSDVLENWSGEVSRLKGLETLMKKYFI